MTSTIDIRRQSGTHAVGSAASTPPAAAPVDISALEQKFGWQKAGWQDQLLRAADKATGKADGKVSCSEIDAYLANPTDTKFLTSTDMAKQVNQLAAKGGTLGTRSFGSSWENSVAYRADKAGNSDGKVTTAELNSYLDLVKHSPVGNALTLWMPDQKAAMFDSAVADLTNEADGLKVTGMGGDVLERQYLRAYEDPNHRTANAVSYELSAADIQMTPADVKRQNNFHADPAYANSATPQDYTNSGYDRGHQKPAEDSPSMEAMDESFLMTNMAPQAGKLNQQSWRYLEQATHELVAATGGKATVVTGSLYLGADGKPLPEDQIKRIGTDKVAVPTASWKAVCLTQPDGTKQMYAYIVPNRSDLPTDQAGIAKLLRDSRVPVSQLEQELGGATLFPDLPADEAAKLKSGMPDVVCPNLDQNLSAKLVWANPTPPFVSGTTTHHA